MNLIVLTGTFKKRPSLKNGVCSGFIKFDKMGYSIVAFQDTANEMAKVKENELVLVEGKLQTSKFNEEWRTQIVVNTIKVVSADLPQPIEPLGTDLNGGNLDTLDLPDEDLPF